MVLSMCAVILAFSHIVQGREYANSGTQCLEPSVENGRLFRGKKDSYQEGDVLVISCDDVYTPLGPLRIKCMSDGRWSNNPPYCKEVECVQLPHLINGTMTPTTQTSNIGTMVTVTCDDGFLLVGSQQLTCSINGTWFPKYMPYCKEMECPDILDIQNGSMSPAYPKRPGYVNFTCDDAFTLMGPSSLTCTDEGKWTPNVMPYCYEVKCPEILGIQNGSMSPAIFKRSGHVNFTCDDGFTLKGPLSLRCTEEGNWTPNVMPYCYEVKCPEILGIQNGSMSPTIFKRSGHVNFSCDDGFTLKGPSSLRCTEEGKWTPNVMPYCYVQMDSLMGFHGHQDEQNTTGCQVYMTLTLTFSFIIVVVIVSQFYLRCVQCCWSISNHFKTNKTNAVFFIPNNDVKKSLIQNDKHVTDGVRDIQ